MNDIMIFDSNIEQNAQDKYYKLNIIDIGHNKADLIADIEQDALTQTIKDQEKKRDEEVQKRSILRNNDFTQKMFDRSLGAVSDLKDDIELLALPNNIDAIASIEIENMTQINSLCENLSKACYFNKSLLWNISNEELNTIKLYLFDQEKKCEQILSEWERWYDYDEIVWLVPQYNTSIRNERTELLRINLWLAQLYISIIQRYQSEEKNRK